MTIQKVKFKKSYPVVLYNAELKKVRLVYRNRTMGFVMENHETKSQMDKEFKETMNKEWTPEHEVEIAMSNGFKRVNDSDDNKHWEIWEAEK